jgi:lipoyl(octanoyl) transferase
VPDHLPDVIHLDLGLIPYSEALALQKKIHREVVCGSHPGAVLTLQHPSVLTLGKIADRNNVLIGAEALKAKGIALDHTDRGGEVTAHNPGQLVVYPILSQALFGMSPKKFVFLMEEAVIQLLGSYGLIGKRDRDHPGVWLLRDKVCAVGVRIKERVSMHGLALNVSNDLTLFDCIIPCGIQGRGVVSLSTILGRTIPIDEVKDRLLQGLSRHFKINWKS